MANTATERKGESPWAGLGRRKVAQWGLGYAAAAWTLLQVIEYLTETYAWPPAIRRIAIPTLALGSLLALVLAWYHGEKGEQKVSRLEAVILVALMALVSGTLWWYGSRLDESAWEPADGLPNIKHVVPTDAASVAVLPFVDMSEAKDQEYFADGLSEEILNALAGIPGLYVPARTSSFQFKGKSGDVAKFAAMLGVASVLEGSVRKSGNRVRITAQLVNAKDGYHLWSETYDRELKDIFVVQAEIAAAISDSLRVRLTPEEKVASTPKSLTANPDAYEAYLLGRHESSKGQAASIGKAIEYFQTAVDLDPTFAVAYAALAVAIIDDSHSKMGMKWSADRKLALEKARAILNRAQLLAPDSPEVLAAAGYWERAQGYARPEGLERALGYFEKSLAANPSSGQVLAWRNATLGSLGRFDSMLAASYEAVKRDPLSLHALGFRIHTLLAFGRRAEVGPLVDRVRSLDEVRGQELMAEIAAHDGDRPAAIRYCMASVRAGGDGGECGWSEFAALGLREEVFAHAGNEAAAHWTLGEFRDAVRLARAAYDEDPAWWEWDLVLWYWVERDYRNSWDFFVRARRSDKQGTGYTGWGRNPTLLLAAADAARRLGETGEASALHERAAEIIEGKVRAAAPFEPDNDLDRAMLAAYEGKDDAAARFLGNDIRTGWTWRLALAAPMFDTARKRNDFQVAWKEQRAVLDRQRAEVLEILCGSNPPPEKYRPQPGTCARMDKRT